MKKAYNYDSSTGEYAGEEIAHPDPRDPGRFLLPAQATFTAPPQTTAGRVAVFDAVKEVWTTPESGPATAELWAQVRAKRDGLLGQNDWTQMPDSPLTTAQTTTWAVYRQALRDITQQADPAAVVWPAVPNSARTLTGG